MKTRIHRFVLILLCGCLVALTELSLAEGPNWSVISTISNRIDGLIQTDDHFIAYKLSPSLTLYTSTNAVDWTESVYELDAIGIGHDAQGTLYAVTSTLNTLGSTAQLWRQNGGGSWDHWGQPISHLLINTGASVAGTHDKLLVKINTVYDYRSGGTWIDPNPPAPLLVTDIIAPTHFTSVANGINIDHIRATTEGFSAVMAGGGHGLAFSTDGASWTSRDSQMSQFGRLLHVWGNLHFLFDIFHQVFTMTHDTPPINMAMPTRYSLWSHPLGQWPRYINYNGTHLIVVDGTTCYTSSDFGSSWHELPLIDPSGLTFHNEFFVLADRTTTNTFIYGLSSPAWHAAGQFIRGEAHLTYAEVIPGFTNYVMPAISFTVDHVTADYRQLEYSTDLHTWKIHSLPTTNDAVTVLIPEPSPSTMFYRWRLLNSP